MTFHRYEPPDDTPADLEREAPAEVEHAHAMHESDAPTLWPHQHRTLEFMREHPRYPLWLEGGA